jgi:hypothetical protein
MVKDGRGRSPSSIYFLMKEILREARKDREVMAGTIVLYTSNIYLLAIHNDLSVGFSFLATSELPLRASTLPNLELIMNKCWQHEEYGLRIRRDP